MRYSHDLMVKKNAPMERSASARDRSQEVFNCRVVRIRAGRAFCCFVGGSAFLYPLNCCCKSLEVRPSWSRRGSL